MMTRNRFAMDLMAGCAAVVMAATPGLAGQQPEKTGQACGGLDQPPTRPVPTRSGASETLQPTSHQQDHQDQ